MTQPVNATDTNKFHFNSFHSVFSRTRLKCEPSNKYENWTRRIAYGVSSKTVKRFEILYAATGHRFELRLEIEICLQMANTFFLCTKVHTPIHYYFGQRKERQKTELPLSLNTNVTKMDRGREDKAQPSLNHGSMWGESLTWGPRHYASGILTEWHDMVVCVRQYYQGRMGEACSTQHMHATYWTNYLQGKPLRIPRYRWKGIKMNIK